MIESNIVYQVLQDVKSTGRNSISTSEFVWLCQRKDNKLTREAITAALNELQKHNNVQFDGRIHRDGIWLLKNIANTGNLHRFQVKKSPLQRAVEYERR